MNEILKLDHIQKFYGNQGNITKAINDISFSVSEGEFVGIMGASGSGKTTLLNCISTIDTVSAGHIYLDGTDVTEIKEKALARFRRENLGFVFQDFNLLDTLTVSENIALALTINNVPVEQIDGKVREMAGSLNITDILDKYPYQVSGGQKQRCACARAIINRPKLILADEPTGALDSHSSQMLLSTMQSINEQLGATILMVTHDAFSASYANRILFLRDGVIFTEILKGQDSRKAFFEKILDVLTMMGGGQTDVR
ncbi:MAG: ABC transporter ATP-binding protein [Oscillospiraceae bacterium]|nr:ABC transporter ATP-binding protein [uncultured Oscillibacter sp.]MCI8527023.1 ABC transporter ATP-binding protein [Oscillospiraceae bacterium]